MQAGDVQNIRSVDLFRLILRYCWKLGLLVWASAGTANSQEPTPQADFDKLGIRLSGSIELSKTDFFYGEPILSTIRLINKSRQNIFYDHIYYGSEDNLEGFIVHVLDAKGNPVNQTKESPNLDIFSVPDCLKLDGVYQEFDDIDNLCHPLFGVPSFPSPGVYDVSMKIPFAISLEVPTLKKIFYKGNFTIESRFHITIRDDPAAVSDLEQTLSTDVDGWTDPTKFYREDLVSLVMTHRIGNLKLLKALLDGPIEAQIYALGVLDRNYPRPQAEAIYLEHLNMSHEEFVRKLLAPFLFFPSQPFRSLLDCLKCDNPKINQSALRSFDRRIAQKYDISDQDERKYFAACLAYTSKERAIPLLKQLLKDPNQHVQEAAKNSLEKFGYREK